MLRRCISKIYLLGATVDTYKVLFLTCGYITAINITVNDSMVTPTATLQSGTDTCAFEVLIHNTHIHDM